MLSKEQLKDISNFVKELKDYFDFFNSMRLSHSKIQLIETSFTEVKSLYEHITIPLHNYLENFDLVSDEEALSVLSERETHLGIALVSNPIIKGLDHNDFIYYVLRHKKFNNNFHVLFNNISLVFDNEETAREAGIIIHKMLLNNIIFGANFFDEKILPNYLKKVTYD